MNYFILFIISFINFNLIFASFTEEFYANWLGKYRKVSGNQNPPRRYKEWIAAATKLNVSIEPEIFKPIFEHLAHFKETGISVPQVRDYLRKIKEFRPTRWDIKGLDTEGLRRNRLHLRDFLYHESFDLLMDLLDPSFACVAIIQQYDEGMVSPADDDQSKGYTDMSDVFRRSADMRKELGEYSDNFMLLQAPTSFHVIPIYAPVFGVYRLKGAKDILFASDQTGFGYYEDRELPIAISAPRWEDKKDAAMFRGSATGINYVKAIKDGIPLTNNPRFKLHQMTELQKAGKLQCNVPLDFGISDLRFSGYPAFVTDAVTKQFNEVSKANISEQFKYKYLVVVDGNGAADRTSLFMASGSLVFLATVLEDWTSNQIIPGEHYIKIKPDLSDLIEKLEWAADNDAEAKRIAQNGREFVLKTMTKSNRQIYNALLFMEYQALFDKEK